MIFTYTCTFQYTVHALQKLKISSFTYCAISENRHRATGKHSYPSYPPSPGKKSGSVLICKIIGLKFTGTKLHIHLTILRRFVMGENLAIFYPF